MTTTDRFNPKPGTGYGECGTCGIDLPTEAEAKDHMASTIGTLVTDIGTRSHGIRILNPRRTTRVRTEIAQLISDATDEVMDRIESLIGRNDITEDEAKDALTGYPDFADAWEAYTNET